MTYLNWSKRHEPARFELTISGVPRVSVEEWPEIADDLSIRIVGAYGDPVLKELIAARYGVSADSVLPVAGTSSGNFIALALAAERGGVVAIEQSVYEPIVNVARFLRLEMIGFRRLADDGFRPDLDGVANSLDRGAVAVVLSDLHNPSGRRCPDDDLREISELCERHDALLIVDEVYRDFSHLYSNVPLGSAASLGAHVVTTNSLTKVYGLGGIRAGWMLASPELIKRAECIWDHLDVDLAAPSSSMAIQVLRNIDFFEERTRRIRAKGHSVYSEWLASESRVVDCGYDGAIFGYVRLPDGYDAEAFCSLLRSEFDTQVVPGSFFGAMDYLRIGFGGPVDVVAEGLSRISRALDVWMVRP